MAHQPSVALLEASYTTD